MAGTEVTGGDKSRNFTTSITLNGATNVFAVLCSTSTAGVLTIVDSTRTICSVMPLVAGQNYPMAAKITGALTITLGGAANATLFYK